MLNVYIVTKSPGPRVVIVVVVLEQGNSDNVGFFWMNLYRICSSISINSSSSSSSSALLIILVTKRRDVTAH
jgi:hypothetical protein